MPVLSPEFMFNSFIGGLEREHETATELETNQKCTLGEREIFKTLAYQKIGLGTFVSAVHKHREEKIGSEMYLTS